ncbi:MAG: hypothetical protein J6V99_02890 [Neisseriaceae bacterium]|nr:hypothetical protein [Neisseriaceae bacterium]
MKISRLLLLTIALFSLNACGNIATQATSQDTLIEKAAKATGENPSHLSIVPNSRHGSLDYLKYQVKSTRGSEYICFYEITGAVTAGLLSLSGRGEDATCAKLTSITKNIRSH